MNCQKLTNLTECKFFASWFQRERCKRRLEEENVSSPSLALFDCSFLSYFNSYPNTNQMLLIIHSSIDTVWCWTLSTTFRHIQYKLYRWMIHANMCRSFCSIYFLFCFFFRVEQLIFEQIGGKDRLLSTTTSDSASASTQINFSQYGIPCSNARCDRSFSLRFPLDSIFALILVRACSFSAIPYICFRTSFQCLPASHACVWTDFVRNDVIRCRECLTHSQSQSQSQSLLAAHRVLSCIFYLCVTGAVLFMSSLVNFWLDVSYIFFRMI